MDSVETKNNLVPTIETTIGLGRGENDPRPTLSVSGRVSSRFREDRSKVYGSNFWLAYVANFLATAANALVFRFADYIDFLQGSATMVGIIVGVGTLISVPIRLWIGGVIDRYSLRVAWIGSGVLYAASTLAFMFMNEIGIGVFIARICFACGLAGMFSSSIAYMLIGIPVHRRAEVLGTLGTSGFIGMSLGPIFGDLIFHWYGHSARAFELMFLTSGGLAVCYVGIVTYLTRNMTSGPSRRQPPFGMMLIKYWPGRLVAAAIMMGMAILIPTTYLTRFCADRDLGGMGTFFLPYTATAFLLRVLGRRVPEKIGRGNAVVVGLTMLIVSLLSYQFVTEWWHLVFPALAAGTAHALLFPCVTTLGAESFPERHRGTGTSLILSFVDCGTLMAAPIMGGLIDYLGFESMFVAAAAAALCVVVLFARSDYTSIPWRAARKALD